MTGASHRKNPLPRPAVPLSGRLSWKSLGAALQEWVGSGGAVKNVSGDVVVTP